MKARRALLVVLISWLAMFGCKRSAVQEQADAGPRTVRVAAASDLKFALDELAVAFQKVQSGIKVERSYGSSGNFYAQLTQRAPFDLFFSADVMYPRRLVEAGLGVANTQFTYAAGRIVIWVPARSELDPEKLGIRALTEATVRKIAIANPEHAPYGKAAVSAMQTLGVYDRVKDKLVLGENVSQAAQFVDSGSADVGVIAMSLVLAPALKDKGRYWEVPLEAYPRLIQGGVMMSWAQHAEAARAFRDFVLGPSGKSILRGFGFYEPETAPAPK